MCGGIVAHASPRAGTWRALGHLPQCQRPTWPSNPERGGLGYREPPGNERMIARCAWAGSDPMMQEYHDREWGTRSNDEAAALRVPDPRGRAGRALLGHHPQEARATIAAPSRASIPRRWRPIDRPRCGHSSPIPASSANRLKVESAVKNARHFLALADEPGGADAFLWHFVGGRPRRNGWTHGREVPATTPNPTP